MSSMFDFDDSLNVAFNAKTAGKNLVTAKHEVLSKTGDFLFLAHSDREFALRCQMVEVDIESAALRKMANVSDSKSKLVRALHEEWKLRHANCACKTAAYDSPDPSDNNCPACRGSGMGSAPEYRTCSGCGGIGTNESYTRRTQLNNLRGPAGGSTKAELQRDMMEHQDRAEKQKAIDTQKGQQKTVNSVPGLKGYEASRTAFVVESMARGVAYEPSNNEDMIKSTGLLDADRRVLDKRIAPPSDKNPNGGIWHKRSLTNPGIVDSLKDTGGGRFYLVRSEAKKSWRNVAGQVAPRMAPRPEYNLFFSGGVPGSALPMTATKDDTGNSFAGYSHLASPTANNPHTHQPCGKQHIPGIQIATAWKDMPKAAKQRRGIPLDKREIIPHWDDTRKFEVGMAACPDHMIALSDVENKRLFSQFAKKNNGKWAYDPENPSYADNMDKIGSQFRDWQTESGPVNTGLAWSMHACGDAVTPTVSSESQSSAAQKVKRLGFLPRARSKGFGGKPGSRSKYGDTEFKCVPGHSSVLFDPEENNDDSLRFTGSQPGCGKPHLYGMTMAAPNGSANQDRNTEGSYIEPNIGDPVENRALEISPIADYEREPISGEKADLGKPMEAFKHQRATEEKVGYDPHAEKGDDDELADYGDHDDYDYQDHDEEEHLMPSDEEEDF